MPFLVPPRPFQNPPLPGLNLDPPIPNLTAPIIWTTSKFKFKGPFNFKPKKKKEKRNAVTEMYEQLWFSGPFWTLDDVVFLSFSKPWYFNYYFFKKKFLIFIWKLIYLLVYGLCWHLCLSFSRSYRLSKNLDHLIHRFFSSLIHLYNYYVFFKSIIINTCFVNRFSSQVF
jgi:hypothetical protein